MSRKRTFIVRVNIDDMAAMLAGLDGPLEKAEWLDGYMVGVHGHPAREAWQEAKRIGYDFGALHFKEVEEFRAEQKAKSDLAELAKLAKKHPDGTHGVPTGTGSGNPAGDPIQQSNNPTIHEAKEPKILKPRFVPPTFDELADYADSVGFKDAQKWMDHYTSNGWKVGKVKMADWKACVRNWNRNPSMSISPAKPRPEWVVTKIEQLKREKRRFEASGRDHSAADIQREIDQLEKGNP